MDLEYASLKIRKFQQFLINYINSVEDLPIEVKRLAVFEILNQLDAESSDLIRKQQELLNKDRAVDKEGGKGNAESI